MRLVDVALPLILYALLLFPLALMAQAPRSSQASRTLHDLFAAEWDYDMQQDPVRASMLGDRRWNDRWPEVDPAAVTRRHEHYRDVLTRLASIDRASLPPPDQLNYDLFRREYETRSEEYAHRLYLIPLDQREGVQTRAELGEALRFETVKDYEDWIARLRSFPAYMDGTIELMREVAAARLVQPKLIMQRVLGQVQKQVVSDPEASPFHQPFTRFPEAMPAADRTRLASAGKEAIRTGVVPSFSRFERFIADEYLPKAFDQVGIWQAPSGGDIYEFAVRKHTSTRLTPEEIHELGVKEVSRIRREMESLKARTGFSGSLAEFFRFLRTDPRFYYTSPDELLTAYRAMAKRIDPRLVTMFRTLPRTPYGVEPIPAITAPDTTTAYYNQPAADGSRAGTYYVNLYKPDTRPKYEMMALSLHEAVPGHHLQIALGMEQQEIPPFRRHTTYNAFVEGWALYAESLGDEMGMFDDPYSKFGQLTYEMWRAVRLVVDTGIHAFRWDRQRAIDFFMENAPKTEGDIVNEIDRYIAWPGQALGYKIGELRIKQLRARAAQARGPRFDVREFHEVVLKNGALPLDALERIVTEWMEKR
jgi:uncharacterized protein (DUF885 family)